MLEEQIQSQRMKGDISRLGFHTTKKGESLGIKRNYPKNKNNPKVNKTIGKKVLNLSALFVTSLVILQMFVEINLIEMQIKILMLGTCL